MTLEPPKTLVEALENLPSGEGRGFTFYSPDLKPRYYAYEALRAEATRRAAHLASLGLRKGDRLALVIPEGDEFVLSLLGAAVAGVVAVPIFPRATFKAADVYVDTVAHITKESGARVLLTMEGTKPYIEGVLSRETGLEKMLTVEEAFAGAPPEHELPTIVPEDVCFLQFTSGSTSRPKGVIVTHRNLVANSTAFLGPHGLDRRDTDVGVSWLPLYHDMGLIGFILGTLVCDIPVVILPTASFARMPRLWLETITKYKGTITFAPNFAYELVTKRVREKDLAQLDLSSLRVAGCGAEPIRARTLQEFGTKFRAAGFDEKAFLPSYGMAESTLAVTFHRLGTPMVVDRVDADAMRLGEARPATSGTKTVLELVGCGRPFPSHELAIIDDAGKPVGERVVGEVVARGPSVSSGYFENPDETHASFRDGWLHTGDLGYLADGNLFICGRIKDLIIIRGANHHPQDIEWAVADIDGVRRGNVVAFSVLRDGSEELVIVAEGNSTEASELRQKVSSKLVAELGLTPGHVAIVPVGTLPKTSSGKAQRRKTKELFEASNLNEHA